MEKDGRVFLGLCLGVLVTCVLLSVIAIIYSMAHPDERYIPNYYLNSPEWTIDTIRTSSSANNSNTVEYKFVKNSKE